MMSEMLETMYSCIFEGKTPEFWLRGKAAYILLLSTNIIYAKVCEYVCLFVTFSLNNYCTDLNEISHRGGL